MYNSHIVLVLFLLRLLLTIKKQFLGKRTFEGVLRPPPFVHARGLHIVIVDAKYRIPDYLHFIESLGIIDTDISVKFLFTLILV